MSSRTAREMSPEALKQFHPFKRFPMPVLTSAARQGAAKKTAESLAEILKERFHASKVVLFGSALRTDFSQWSDIDLAVWGVSASNYFKAIAYASGYSIDFKVDLVDAEDCCQSLLRHILENGVEL